MLRRCFLTQWSAFRQASTTSAMLKENIPSNSGGGSNSMSFVIGSPRRALLYLPAHDIRKAQKASSLDADCVCLDLEDAVAMNRKEGARKSLIHVLQSIDFGQSDVAVRINSVSSGLASDDLRAIFESNVLPRTLVVPKVDIPADIEWLFEETAKLLKRFPREDQVSLKLLTQVESGLGLLNLQRVCEYDLSNNTASDVYEHEGVIFGGDDYAAAIGATRSTSNKELLYARQHVVATVKAYGLQAIDIVNIRFKDLDSLGLEAAEGIVVTAAGWMYVVYSGAAWGFDGKQVIHPDQVPVVQRCFSPTPEKLKWAMEILDAFYENQSEGRGAFNHNNHMIDMPTVLQCQNIYRLGVISGQTAPSRYPSSLKYDRA
eukprot:gene829-4109_t